MPVSEAWRGGVIDVCVFVFSRYSTYIPHFPLVFVATLPSLPLLNEAVRVAASAPAVGGHRVNPAWLPLSLRLPSLSLYYASGLLTAAGAGTRGGDEEGGEVTGGADTPGFPPPAQQNELYQTLLDT